MTDYRIEKLQLKVNSINGYELLLDQDSVASDDPQPIGVGGSGIVFKAAQILHGSARVERAIKFFMYEENLLNGDSNKKPISEEDFISEIGNFTVFNHQSLVRVVGAGFYALEEEKVPYIITDYVEGSTLQKVISDDSDLSGMIRKSFTEEPDQVLSFLIEIASAIAHIHELGFAHCDIAPKNIFIKFDGRKITPVLGDLGISKKIVGQSSKTRVVGSKKWMPETAAQYLDTEVDYNIFSSLQPYWDVYSFSKTGLELIEIFKESEPRSWFSSLKKDLLKACDSNAAVTISMLIERLEFLKPIHREVARIPELSMGVGTGRKKMMPVEALTTTIRLEGLIRHPALLRLSFVPQLTTANQILPGASHTRYEHTLGVLETMRRYLLSLLDERDFLEHLSVRKIETALVCAALICASRFPLSNVIQEIRDKNQVYYSEFSKKSLFMEVLRMTDVRGTALKDYIRHNFPQVSISNVVSILCEEESEYDSADELIQSLLNNSLDVRVIDFVRRDAHHLGVISGDSFSIDELLPHVTIYEHKLALKVQGVSIAEQIVLLRYWLFSRVYWNIPNRTFCAMAKVVFLELHDEPGFCDDFRKGILNLDQRGVIEYLISASRKYKRAEIEDIAERLSGREHRLFRLALEVSKVDGHLTEESFEKIHNLTLEQIRKLQKNILEVLKKAIGYQAIPQGVFPIIFDYPIEPGSNKLGNDVQVKLRDNAFKNLLEVSGIVRGANDGFFNQLSKLRVFLHPEIRVTNKVELEKKLIEEIAKYISCWSEDNDELI